MQMWVETKQRNNNTKGIHSSIFRVALQLLLTDLVVHNIVQATSTGDIPLLYQRSAVDSLKSPTLGYRGWETRSTA